MVMIVFTEAAMPYEIKTLGKDKRTSLGSTRLRKLEQQLEQAREDLRTTREEMQNSQEELKSTNEELQSTNEELTTSKEQMQSRNEELQTVNHEPEIKVDELSRANNDMKNLLNSSDVAALFLDDALNVRRFTAQTTASSS
jgi:two-component system CheB/CheR fusion protein